jgi:ElaB/YqjD/DUF883 family membrane-anchored ribosome-binding protein
LTLGGLLGAIATYAGQHVDPSAFQNPWVQVGIGTLGAIIGVLTHHTNTSAGS